MQVVLVRDLGELLEADTVVLVGVRHARLREHAWHAGRADVPVGSGDGAIATDGAKTLASFFEPAPPSSPIFPICSTPTARPMSASPALIDSITVRSAVAPVAQAFETL